jgi:hypothetical protein
MEKDEEEHQPNKNEKETTPQEKLSLAAQS